MKLRVTAATTGDVPQLLRMTRALAAYEKVPHQVSASEADLREALFGPRPMAEAAIGYVDDEPAGMIVFFATFSTFVGRPGLYVEDIFVDEKWRGRGLGRELMAYAAQAAVERGCARLEWSVLNWNEPAIGFYRGLGAKPMDQWTVYRLSGGELVELAGRAEGSATCEEAPLESGG
jgi:GNAT superfamily N-acetyltransferase